MRIFGSPTHNALGHAVIRGRGRVIAPWTPAALFASGENGLWVDFSDLSTLYQDSGGTTPVTTAGQPIGLALDKSGNGLNISQATAGQRPLWVANGSADFDGTDDNFQTGTYTVGKIFSATGGASAYAYTYDLANTLRVLGGEQGSTNFFRVSQYADTRSSPNRFANVAPDGVDDYIDYPSAQTADTRVALLNCESNGVARGYYNGVSLLGTTTITQELSGTVHIDIGFQQASTAGTRSYFNGKMFQILYIDRQLTAGEIAQVQTYFAAKAGI